MPDYMRHPLIQMVFAIITPALISGAIVGRMKFGSYAIFIVLWSTVVVRAMRCAAVACCGAVVWACKLRDWSIAPA